MKTRITAAFMAAVFALGMLGPAWTGTARAQNYRYDDQGYRYDQYGNRVDAYGNRIDRYGNRYDQRTTRWGRYDRSSRYSGYGGYGVTLRAGTNVDVRLDSRIETDDAREGQSWSGTIARDVF